MPQNIHELLDSMLDKTEFNALFKIEYGQSMFDIRQLKASLAIIQFLDIL